MRENKSTSLRWECVWHVEGAARRPVGLEHQAGGKEGMRSEITQITKALERTWPE